MKKFIVCACAFVGCGGGLEPAGIAVPIDEQAPSEAHPPRLAAPEGGLEGPVETGRSELLVEAEVPVEGGVVRFDAPGHPLSGFSITILPDSFDEARLFRVSARPIARGTYHPELVPLGSVIEVEYGGGLSNHLMLVQVPGVPSDEPVIGFQTHSGLTAAELTVMPRLAQGGGWAAFVVSHFSDITVALRRALAPTIDSGFLPGRDDWPFHNKRSEIAPYGHCSGQSLSMAWYYATRRDQGRLNSNVLGGGRFDSAGSKLSEVHPEHCTSLDYCRSQWIWHDDVESFRFAAVVWSDIQQKVTNYKYNLYRYLQLLKDSNPWLFSAPWTTDQIVLAELTAGIWWGTQRGQPSPMILLAGHEDLPIAWTEGTSLPAPPIIPRTLVHGLAAYRVDHEGVHIADPNDPGQSRIRLTMGANGRFNKLNYASVRPGPASAYDRFFAVPWSALVTPARMEFRYGQLLDHKIGTPGASSPLHMPDIMHAPDIDKTNDSERSCERDAGTKHTLKCVEPEGCLLIKCEGKCTSLPQWRDAKTEVEIDVHKSPVKIGIWVVTPDYHYVDFEWMKLEDHRWHRCQPPKA